MERLLKNRSTIFFIFFVFLFVLFFGFNTLSVNQPQTTDLLTTNLDLIHKQILDTGSDASSDDGSTFSNLFELGTKWLSQNFNIWRFYQNMANPSSKYIVLDSGLRKEEVANILSKELKWNLGTKLAFIAADKSIDNENKEGYYSPGGYLLPNKTTPNEAYAVIMDRFDNDVTAKYATTTANVINVDMALKIASIIERESGGTSDMRLISGVIWNRIFKNMKLEMDATLQYAKGSNRNGWWPPVLSEDKYIDSPYNTYKNKGLPPTPISNVSMAALKAALNPQKTKCIFYLHDKRGNIHCSVTYKEHKANIKKFYK